MAKPTDKETMDLVAEFDAEFGKKVDARATADTFTWEPRPEAEVVRLTELLRGHLSGA